MSLECPVCNAVPVKSAVLQCVNGHVVCASCYAELRNGKVCPQGR